MKKINFYEYLPQRYAATSEQVIKVRNLIYNFKSGRKEAANFAADLIVRLLWNWYGHKCNEYTIVCVPASLMLNIVTALVISLMLLLAVVSKKTLCSIFKF